MAALSSRVVALGSRVAALGSRVAAARCRLSPLSPRWDFRFLFGGLIERGEH